MLQELLNRVTYADEFFTELSAVYPLLPECDKVIAKNLIAKHTSLNTIEEIKCLVH